MNNLILNENKDQLQDIPKPNFEKNGIMLRKWDS